MRLLADENVHRRVVDALRQAGHLVEWVRETSAGTSDAAILMRHDIAHFVLITNDRDFGDLIFRQGFPAPRAILFTRMPHRDWRATTDLIVDELERGITADHMTTITKDGTRHTPFPTGEHHG